MADMHVRQYDSNRRLAEVVMHFPIASANNDVGVNYRTALVNSGMGGTTILPEGTGPGQITTAEKNQIEAGEVYEHRKHVKIMSGGDTNPQMRATLRHFYAQEEADLLAQIQQRLRFFGHEDNEA
jgi:hypothetical protein